jgi:hypothetical protein
MEIDAKKYKTLLIEIIAGFKKFDTELLAYKMVFEAVVKPQYADAELSLETARNNTGLQKMMDEKYDGPLETLLKQADDQIRVDTLLEWFAKWKPKGPIN